VFVPANLTDNPYLDQDEYRANLQQLAPVTRQQLLNGDWSARASGGLFRREDFVLVDAGAIPTDAITWCRFWDLAGTEAKPGQSARQAYTAGVLMGRDGEGNFWVVDVKRARLAPAGVQDLLVQTAHEDRATYGAVMVRQEQEPGSAGKFVIADFARKLAGFDYRGQPATGSKVERSRPLSAAVSNKLVRVVAASWNGAFYDEFDAFPQDGVTRDQVDAASGAHAVLTTSIRRAPKSFQG
jgi:predicted phage terminase large subunit-like protein